MRSTKLALPLLMAGMIAGCFVEEPTAADDASAGSSLLSGVPTVTPSGGSDGGSGDERQRNGAPTCVATASGAPVCGGDGTLQLDATGSADPEGGPLTYAWTSLDCDFATTIVAPNHATTAVQTGPWFGCDAICTFALTVSDGDQTATCKARLKAHDKPPTLHAPAPVSLECTAKNIAAADPRLTTFFAAAYASSPCQGDLSVTHNAPKFFGLGKTLVSFSSKDGCGHTAAATSAVQVHDTAAPVYKSGPNKVLWPPNHKYVTLTLGGCGQLVDACHGALDLDAVGQITSVTSDEPEDVLGDKNCNCDACSAGKPNSGKLGPDSVGGGDGATLNDIVLVNSHTVKVRSERAGGRNGRVYTIHFTVKDPAGNLTSATCRAEVPHDQGTGVHAIADPVEYWVVP